MDKTPSYKRILILGDAGRGKSTFAARLSEKLSIPHYSTDDFYWKVKFTEANDRRQSEIDIARVYTQDAWIMEGTTRRLILEGLNKADIIYLLKFKYIVHQYYFLIARNLTRKHERFIDLWRLLKHVTYKKYKKGYGPGLPSLEELLKPHEERVVRLYSFRDIKRELKRMR